MSDEELKIMIELVERFKEVLKKDPFKAGQILGELKANCSS